MANTDSALLVISKALWDPHPTTDEKSERFLAQALGYPGSWHVVRTIEKEPTVAAAAAAAACTDDKPADVPSTSSSSSNTGYQQQQQQQQNQKQKEESRLIIVDRIYAGDPSTGVDMWFNHHAAQEAATEWVEGESSPYQFKGGQLLPRKPKFAKGDQVRVNYDGKWWSATISKRNERKEGYRYTVFYPQDGTTQTQVLEEDIELMGDPHQMAEDMGLSKEWQAKLNGKKWKISSPDGKTFTSKASAMKHFKKLMANNNKNEDQDDDHAQKTTPELSAGDPPWRTAGHRYIGRRVKKIMEHQKSATRTVKIEQNGTVVGWIADTDVDTNGEPGFVSEQTNQPANLFCVVYDDDKNHPYFSLLLQTEDLEEYELEECLLPVDEQQEQGQKDERSSKKQKT